MREAKVSSAVAPAVSVLMTAYNAGEHLQPAVDSILAQTYELFEFLLVDDGSTDGSVERLNETCIDERIKIIRQANAGKPAAVNRAMEVARGEWIAIQDADDLANPRRLELLLDRVERDSTLGAVFSGFDLLINNKPLAPITREKDVLTCRDIIRNFGMPSHDPTIMFRRDLGRKVRYDEELRIGEGHDFILRLGEIAPMAVVAENLYSYRVEWTSLTRNDPQTRHRYVARVLEKACHRRGLEFSVQFPHMVETNESFVFADNGLHRHFIESVMSARELGRSATAWKSAMQSIAFQPYSGRYYLPLAYAIMPLAVIVWFRRRRHTARVTAEQ